MSGAGMWKTGLLPHSVVQRPKESLHVYLHLHQ